MTTTQIKAQSTQTIAKLVSDPNRAMALRSTQSIILALDEQIAQIERAVLRQVRPDPTWKLLKTVWGIGPILATTIRLEAGDLDRFDDVGNFVSYRSVREVRAHEQWQKEGRRQHQERQSVPVVGIHRSGQLRHPRLRACTTLLPAQSEQDESDFGAQGPRAQARTGQLLCHAREQAIRPGTTLRLTIATGARASVEGCGLFDRTRPDWTRRRSPDPLFRCERRREPLEGWTHATWCEPQICAIPWTRRRTDHVSGHRLRCRAAGEAHHPSPAA